jgi:hypothetical protein
MIRSVHINSCLAAQIRLLMFKGPGSFKTIVKIGGNVDELKAYRLVSLTSPLLFHFTLPLKVLKATKEGGRKGFQANHLSLYTV